MSAVQRYLLAVDDDRERANSIARDTAKGVGPFRCHRLSLIFKALETKKTTLIEVVRTLGDYIVDEDSTRRTKVIEYLTQVIADLPPRHLSRQQTQVLCQFLCDRIEDGGAIGGLKSLQASERYNGEMATLTFRA